ncbi:phage tail tip lysozyme [Staphylococcus equorum]|uniref:phage tail tip lysozyme n=1 Tax=Staphylococcus equorum TaxID=246432 RepID=UPI001867E937|nr:phage tail tip lysozyme [Staphylococcus equorum]
MSKKKDFEYRGKLNEVKQTDDDLQNNETSNHQPTNQPPNSNNISDNNDKALDSNNLNGNAPEVRQHNDDLENNDENNNDVSPQQSNVDNEEREEKPTDNEPSQSNDDLKNPDEENSNSNDNSDEDKHDETNQQGNNVDDGNNTKENTANDDESVGSNNKTDDSNLSDEDNKEDNVKQQSTNEDKSDDEPKQNGDDSTDSTLEDSSMKDKALNKIDPNLAKASKLKDLSKMNKEDAKEELIEVTKSLAKKKIAATVATYLLPIILPILGAILAIVLVVLMVISAVNVMDNKEKTQEGCSVVDKQSSNISNSKDAEKNAENIFKYTKKHVKGSTNKGIAAWLGNINEESGGTFSSSTIQGGSKYKEDLAKDPSAGGYAFGFAQLDSDRRVKLIKYAEKKDKKWSDMELQLDYILNHDGSDSDLIKKLVKEDSDIDTTTADIMNDWERAGAKESLPKRQAASKKYYSKFSKMDGDSDSESNIEDSTSSASDNSDAGANSGCNDDSNSKTDGELGDSVKANNKSGKVLKQWESKDKIPKKYSKHIKLPDYRGYKLKSAENIFPSTGDKGQCTELTFSYLSQLYKGKQPTNGNGNVIYKAYEEKGAKVTEKPTVGYGFSSNPPYAGATLSSVGHTGVVIGVMDDGKWLMSNYNLNGEANKDESRVETFALVDGNKKKDGIKFFSGVGGSKIKSK